MYEGEVWKVSVQKHRQSRDISKTLYRNKTQDTRKKFSLKDKGVFIDHHFNKQWLFPLLDYKTKCNQGNAQQKGKGNKAKIQIIASHVAVDFF